MITNILYPGKNDRDYFVIASKLLKNGSVVALPTDTVYGLFADLFNLHAVEKIFEFKKRDFKKPFAAYINNIEMLEHVCTDIPKSFYKLYDSFLPGPLTIVLKKNRAIPDIVTNGKDSIAIRIPDNEILLNIIKEFSSPIAGTSANISGTNSSITSSEVRKDFDGKIELLIDGTCKFGIESTIISLFESKPVLIREGVINKKDIEDVIGEEIHINS